MAYDLTPHARLYTALYLIIMCVLVYATLGDKKMFIRGALVLTNMWLLVLSIGLMGYGGTPEDVRVGAFYAFLSMAGLLAFACYFVVSDRTPRRPALRTEQELEPLTGTGAVSVDV
jgi:hypothetical protein